VNDLTFERVPSKRYRALVDFVVSGKSILAELERRGYDVVPRVSDDLVPIDQETRLQLLIKAQDDLPNGRVALYTCPCGDYGCGVVSALIEQDGEHIVWSDFRYENNYDDDVIPLERLGPFRFKKSAYRDTVMCLNALL